ncbi:unnamed protein product [Bursaphelenchus xylophilus]|uniref:(pine wood nematode) hypothetical protein n=1 Tax=Bursaphelenchus xylophilus TaxID=6326 RepID=A0A1I7SM48_BURXY|nr:unnamed protein product [Bursaphelenchus xylophilus]CAG9129996.1 unnamed protein product [Bursaphelenchus xylophilus]
MADSDSDDSFHSAFGDDQDEEQPHEQGYKHPDEATEEVIRSRDKTVIKEEPVDHNSSERFAEPKDVYEESFVSSDKNTRERLHIEENLNDVDKTLTSDNEIKPSSDGWEENWGDESSDSDWENWGEKEEERNKKHHLKHVRPTVHDIPSDSTEAEEEVDKSKKRERQLEHQSQSIWDWSGFSEAVSAVGDKISNVVETGLGLPAPEEMAQLSISERRKLLEEAQNAKEPEPSLSSDEATEPQSPSPSGIPNIPTSGFGGLFSGLMNGGLDVLESLGKKTFETLTVKDETERRKFFLSAVDSSDASLSEMLKEVKKNKDFETDVNPSRKARFGYGSANLENAETNFITLFERNEGMVHLEGLELISSSQKQRITSDFNEVFDEKINEFIVEDVSECGTDDFVYEMKKCLSGVDLPFKADNVLKADKELVNELEKTQRTVDQGLESGVEVMHQKAIQSLAKFTAHSIQALHKISQLMLLQDEPSDLESVFAFTFVLCRRLSFYASQYANLLSVLDSSTTVDNVVTNIFFECSNACHYVKKALSLLKPLFCK